MIERQKERDASSENQREDANQKPGSHENSGNRNLREGMEPEEPAKEKGKDTGRNHQEIPPGNEETLGNP